MRHGESEWNKLNLFTGWKDPALTEKGTHEALLGAQALVKAGYTAPTQAYTSVLQRANITLAIILKELHKSEIPITRDEKLNERDYGDLTGLNKDDARKKFGEEQVHIWRRSYDIPPPNGESLKLTAERALPYYHEHILPKVIAGENIIVAAHGNSLRAIIMDLEGLSGEQVVALELATGVPIVYEIDAAGVINKKSVLAHGTPTSPLTSTDAHRRLIVRLDSEESTRISR